MTDEDRAKFFTLVANAKSDALLSQSQVLPAIEVPLKLILEFNRGKMDGVYKSGYFVFDGVKVCIEGQREVAEKRDALTTEDMLHGSGKK